MWSEILLLAVALYFLYKWLKPIRPPNFPPGPENYPVIGGCLEGLSDPVVYKAATNMGEKYGPLTGLYLGKNLSLIVNGYEAVKQVLMRDEFNSRPMTLQPLFQAYDADWGQGLIFGHGESFKEQKRFTLRHLRDLGFGKTSMEGVIQDEISVCFQNLSKLIQTSNPKEGVAIQSIFDVSIINILLHVVSGKRFEQDDEEFRGILENLALCFRSGNILAVICNYPFLQHFPYFKGIWKNAVFGAQQTVRLIRDSVTEHKMARKVGNTSHDYIHAYLQHLEDNKGDDSINRYFNEQELVRICSELFAGGAESTSNSLAFAMMYMILYPEVQTKIQKEIDSVVGMDRLPSLDDRSELPFTEAVLNELFRVSHTIPFTAPYTNSVDTEFFGYNIPKGTLIVVNLKSVSMEKGYWGDPEVFRPERFIDATGKFVKNDRALVFGIGKHSCPGESLVRMNYFLFFTSMMQRFRLEMVPGKPKPSTVPMQGFSLAPKPFRAIFVSRN